MSVDHLQEGLSLVTRAVQHDKNGETEQAADLYQKCLVQLEQARLIEKDPQRQAVITQKIKEYKERCTLLQDRLKANALTERMSKLGVGTLPSQQGLSSAPPPSAPASSLPPPSFPAQGSAPSFQPQPFFPPNTSAVYVPNQGYPPPNTLDKGRAYEIAIELTTKGKQEDDARRFEQAFLLYKQSFDYFVRAMQEETSPDLKARVAERMRVFLQRSEQIAASMALQPSSSSSSASSSSYSPVPGPTGPPPSLSSSFSSYPTPSFSASSYPVPGPYAPSSGPSCSVCHIAFGPTEEYKISSDHKPYHAKCLESTIGLVREESKSFLTGRGKLTLRAQIPKKTFIPGEPFSISAHVQNLSGKKALGLVVLVLRIETTVELTKTSHGYEKKPHSRESKVGKQKYTDQFPMELGEVDLSLKFQLPSTLDPSELGTAAVFVREYQLIVKCKMGKPHGDVKCVFPLIVQKRNT